MHSRNYSVMSHAALRNYTCLVHHRRELLNGKKFKEGIPEEDDTKNFIASVNASSMVESRSAPIINNHRYNPIYQYNPGSKRQRVYGIDFGSNFITSGLVSLIRFTCLPLRWTPGRLAEVHYGTPSAGDVRPVSVFVVGKRDAKIEILSCSREEMSLIPLPPLREEILKLPSGTHFVAVADIRNGNELYGELSLILAAIEGGMWYAQFRIIAVALGFQPSTSSVRLSEFRETTDAINPFGGDGRLVLTACRLANVKLPEILSACAIREIPSPELERRHYGPSAILTEALSEGRSVMTGPRPRAPRLLKLPTNLEAAALIKASYNRTSGTEGPQALPASFDRIALIRLLSAATSLINIAVDDLSSLADVMIRMAIRFPDGKIGEILQLNLANGAGEAITTGFGSAILEHIELDGLPRLITILGIDENKSFQPAWSTSPFSSYQLVGQIAQAVCLGAGTLGLSARPLRSFDQDMSDGCFPITHRTILQIEIGSKPLTYSSLLTTENM